MLLELSIKDFALIDNVTIEFKKGLNILTGETGAGKSIIIDSVNFVLGERVSKGIIRTGADKAEVTAVFELIDNPELKRVMEDSGLETDEEVLILSRELNSSGRNICRINNHPVTASLLKSISSFLIDIHGQHEHQSLLNEGYHIEILDMFGGDRLIEYKSKVHSIYLEVQEIKRQLKSVMGDDIERERKLNLLDFQLKEIDGARLKDGEEEELLKNRNILANSEKLYSVLSQSYSLLYESNEERQAIYDSLGYVVSELRSISAIDDKINRMLKSVEDAYYTLEGTISDIREYRDRIDFSPELINEVESRLDLINKLKRKYGKTIEDILKYRDSVYNEMQDIQNREEIIEKLKGKLSEKISLLDKASRELSDLRKSAAKVLSDRIVSELKFLGMEKSVFNVNFEAPEKDGHPIYGENGIDVVNFLISLNPGEPVKPLSKVASGGEISRIMLAIKTVLADIDSIPSLIFDEIDTGISGKAAQAVAEKLSRISLTHQVICVTHLPQIASMADTHFYIEKTSTAGATRTGVEKIEHLKRVAEIARMLGGAKITDLTLRHAEEMINLAHNIKVNKNN